MIKSQDESIEALSEERRRLWLAVISRADPAEKILENDRVCGDHFHSGKAAPLWDKNNPDWVPSLNLGHDKLNQSATKECDTATKLERARRVTERMKRQLQRHEDELKQKINKPDGPVKHIFQHFDNGPRPSDVIPDTEDVTLEVENLVLNNDIGVQTGEFSYVFEPSPKQNRLFDGSFFHKDNDKVRFYTGLHSFQVLMKTFHFIEPHVKRRSMHLNKFQEFIMVLMKLTLNASHLDLAYRFHVSRPVVTRVISAWLVIMDVRLSPLRGSLRCKTSTPTRTSKLKLLYPFLQRTENFRF